MKAVCALVTLFCSSCVILFIEQNFFECFRTYKFCTILVHLNALFACYSISITIAIQLACNYVHSISLKYKQQLNIHINNASFYQTWHKNTNRVVENIGLHKMIWNEKLVTKHCLKVEKVSGKNLWQWCTRCLHKQFVCWVTASNWSSLHLGFLRTNPKIKLKT